MRVPTFQNFATGTLVVCAIAMTGAAVRRELQPASGPTLYSISPEVGPPELVEEWRSLVSESIIFGDSNAEVIIIEFGDLECPFCRLFHEAYDAVKAEHGSRIALGFIHYPLGSHKFAVPAAKAAECAGEQGRAAEYIGAVYVSQDSIGLKSWTKYAEDAGVTDTITFAKCVLANRSFPRVQRGSELGRAIGVRGTPTIIVNGWRYPVPPTQELSSIVNAFLETGSPPR